MSFGHFDETDTESWYFGAMSSQEATKLLEHEMTGTFLVRDSTTFQGEHVLCVKEKSAVVQYVVHRKEDEKQSWYLREEMSFPDLPSLLRFYKKNLLGTTPLVQPREKDVIYRNHPPRSMRDVQSLHTPGQVQDSTVVRASAPAGLQEYAVVIQSRSPSAYNIHELELKEGDIIRILKKCPTGRWTGVVNGKEGIFPFTHVRLLAEDEVGSKK